MILRDGWPQLVEAAQTLGGGNGISGNGRENTWLIARHEDCSVGADDERRRRAVTETAGGDVHGVADSGHETRPLPRLYIVIGTVTEGQKGSAVNAAPRVHAAVGRATDGVRGAAGHGNNLLVAPSTAPERVDLV